jgi:hypothetical protein
MCIFCMLNQRYNIHHTIMFKELLPLACYVKEKFHVQIGYITTALEANEILRSDEECHIPQCVVYDNIYRYYGI